MADIVRATYYVTDADGCRHRASRSAAKCSAISARLQRILVVVGLYKPEMKVEIEVTAKRRTA